MSTDKLDKLIAADAAAESSRKAIVDKARANAANAALRNENAHLRAELLEVQQQLGLTLALEEAKSRAGLGPIQISPSSKPNPAAFVQLCSDWHVGEVVDPDTVSGRNAYNPTVVKKRVSKLAEGGLWMIEAWRSGRRGYGWDMDTALCWLGGDMMTGMIHEDLQESNSMSPTGEILFLYDLINQLLTSYAEHPGIKQVIVPCNFGNHGRDTKKMRVNTAWSRSHEYLLYKFLEKQYAKHPKIRIQVPKDEIHLVDLFGHKLRFAHGHQVSYGGGVGGVTIPLIKWVMRQDATDQADLTHIGHHHTYIDIGNAIVNNSLIGFNPYGKKHGYAFSRASQVCYLLEARRGKRMSQEILVQ
jgi:hypothetical protein